MEVAPNNSDFARGLLVGVASTLAFLIAALVAVLFISTDRYSLDHWKLNVRTPVSSLWMNLGYWKTPSGEAIHHFDEACAALLREVLETAGVIDIQNASSKSGHRDKSLAILDVGFGCGDQTWELSKLARLGGWKHVDYVGLTFNMVQLEAAASRMIREQRNGQEKFATVQIFGADAAKPGSWSSDARQAVQSLTSSKLSERWLLALDCLYHFSPSREPVIQFAAQNLKANFMAFDLVLDASTPSYWVFLAKMIGLLMGCPWGAFLSGDEYRDMLVQSGYDKENIEVRDVSDEVFPGLVKHLTRQDAALIDYGISLGAGFRLARTVFSWFGRASVIKAVIVVARTPARKSD